MCNDCYRVLWVVADKSWLSTISKLALHSILSYFWPFISLQLSLYNRNDNMIFGHLLSGWLFISVQCGRKFSKVSTPTKGLYPLNNEPCSYINALHSSLHHAQMNAWLISHDNTHTHTLLCQFYFYTSSSDVKLRLKLQSDWDSHSRFQEIDLNTAVRVLAMYGLFFCNTAVIGMGAYSMLYCSLFYLLIHCRVSTLRDAGLGAPHAWQVIYRKLKFITSINTGW